MKTFQNNILLLLFLFLWGISAQELSIKHMTGHPTSNVISIRPYMQIINDGAEPADLSELAIDYYIYDETIPVENLSWELYHCDLGNIYELNFYALDNVYELDGKKANIKCEITFNTPITLSPGATLEMRHSIFPIEWQHTFAEADDWSYSPSQNYTYNENIVIKNYLTGEIIYGHDITNQTTNPRPYNVIVNWMGHHSPTDFNGVEVREGDAYLNTDDNISYIYYQEQWTKLSDVQADLTNYATKEYVDNAVIIGPNSISANQISKAHLVDVNADLLDGMHADEIIDAASGGDYSELLTQIEAINAILKKDNTGGIHVGDYVAVRAILDSNELYDIKVTDLATEINEDGRVTKLYAYAGPNANPAIRLNVIPAEIQNLTELESLSGMYQPNTVLPSEIGNLTKLRYLSYVYGGASVIPAEIGNISSLESLTFFRNSIETLPAEVANCINLNRLYINMTNLRTLPDEIVNLTSLTELELSDNKLCDENPTWKSWADNNDPDWSESQNCLIDGIFIDDYNAVRAILDANELYDIKVTDLATEINEDGRVTKLYAYAGPNANPAIRLNVIPAEIQNLTELESLSGMYQPNTVLPSEIGNLTKLKYISYVYGGASVIPAEIGNISSLESLTFFRNSIETLPAEVANCTNLNRLYINMTNLRSLPDEIVNLTSLTELELSGNKLCDENPIWKSWADNNDPDWSESQNCLIDGIFIDDYNAVRAILDANELYDIKVTDLATEINEDGRITKLYAYAGPNANPAIRLNVIPAEIQNLTELESLSGMYQPNTVLPSEIGNLTKLKYISYVYGGASVIPAEIGNISSLESLTFFRNSIETLPAEVANCINLNRLYINMTNLRSLPDEIVNLNSLTELELSDNKLCDENPTWKSWADNNDPNWQESQNCN